VATDGAEGLRKAKETAPDLILLDVIMPEPNGFTVAKRLKEDAGLAKIPVLMLTSYSAKGSGTGIPRSSGYELDAEDYIEKPVSPADLLAAVKRNLKG
jgi:CheY-like chemotaxis protein